MKRILDTSEIDMNNQLICNELEVDLRRMDKLSHIWAPEGSNAYKVSVTPGFTYMPAFHRFNYEIQYGLSKGKKFTPIGESVKYSTATLPWL